MENSSQIREFLVVILAVVDDLMAPGVVTNVLTGPVGPSSQSGLPAVVGAMRSAV